MRKGLSKASRGAHQGRAPEPERVRPEKHGDRRELIRRSIDKVLTEHSDLMAKLSR